MRKVALIGRTNVGKSSLFNRLIGRRQAIVEDTPGVTRDRHYAVLELEGRNLLLIDTGGFFGEKEGLEAQVAQQVRFAVEEADLLLWVVDASVGVVPADEDFGEWLRHYRRPEQPLWLIVNKVDNTTRAEAAVEFHRLGVEPMYLVSAATGRGIPALKEALSAYAGQGEPAQLENLPRFALIGRPNVGKSSLLNALLHMPRAIVSDIPGTTRDALYELSEWKGRKFYWIDTAGLRRKARIPALSLERYAALRSLEALFSADVVLLVVDATEALTAQDMTLLRQAEKHGRGIVILLNKADLLSPSEQERLLQWAQMKVRPLDPVPILLVSALTGRGVGEIPAAAFKVYEAGQREIPTRQLNDQLLPILKTHPHPVVGTVHPSVRFIQQVGTLPPTFLLHVRHAEELRQSYLGFVENQIRKIFPFPGWRLKFRIKEAE
ncbi:MAG: ribosome biogenesis GTPase Der [Bacteroidia bacterium]|nr:ribosome biogenesis GTPase Der [Bacteroidia bacterium]MCX7763840.1 ribosome biogenesis GTPase Der [Bacteroidia bacterium]MDW8056674.1 ribosome biogenesis GTPase Der [Bacteroidia bacterium]